MKRSVLIAILALSVVSIVLLAWITLQPAFGDVERGVEWRVIGGVPLDATLTAMALTISTVSAILSLSLLLRQQPSS